MRGRGRAQPGRQGRARTWRRPTGRRRRALAPGALLRRRRRALAPGALLRRRRSGALAVAVLALGKKIGRHGWRPFMAAVAGDLRYVLSIHLDNDGCTGALHRRRTATALHGFIGMGWMDTPFLDRANHDNEDKRQGVPTIVYEWQMGTCWTLFHAAEAAR
ncbi:hypothetical protein BRADI_3g31597v3 [Brachypodium distachyon]|uniref:Uncharacterized protein n=1 Tax=Brachypodium distachyon TaxID=15368 RepID=A0A2K2D0E8_BRADI|nr:hypothetical protein BRADI_3g31597v3 [Brachypodium distachyon]